MPAKKILNYARSRSETHRKYIAYGITGFITAVIVVVWLLSIFGHRFTVSPTTVRRTDNQGLIELQQGIADISTVTRQSAYETGLNTIGQDINTEI